MKRALSFFLVYCMAQAAAAQAQTGRRSLALIVSASRDEAADIRSQILAGKSFESMALLHSIGESAAEGGYIGSVRLEDVAEVLRAPLRRLEPGQVSAVTQAGDQFLLLRWFLPEEDDWRSEYSNGLQMMGQGQLVQATAALKKAVDKAMALDSHDFRTARSVLALSESYRRQNNYSASEPLARQAVDLMEGLLGRQHPRLLPSLENLAAIEQKRGSFEEAIALHLRVAAIRWSGFVQPGSPDTAVLVESLADVLSKGYFRDAGFAADFKRFADLLGHASLQKAFYATVGEGFWRLSLGTEAAAIFESGIRAYPSSREVRYAQADQFVKAFRYEKALAAFESASRLEGPADVEADRKQRSHLFERIGGMNMLLSRLDDAMAAYKSALELDSLNAEPHIGLASVYVQREKWKEAEEEFREAIAIDPANSGAWRGVAELYQSLGRFREAVSAAEKALESNPQDRGAQYLRATSLLRAGDERGPRTLEAFRKQEEERLQADRKHREISELIRNAEARFGLGQPEEALSLLHEGLGRESTVTDQARLFMSLGLLQARLGRHQEAIGTFQTMIERGYDDPLIHWNLSAEFDVLGDHPRALQHRAIGLQGFATSLQTRLN